MDINVIDYTNDYVNLLYLAGRGCYGLEYLSNETISEKRQFLRNIIKNQHESVLEHAKISILIHGCSRSFMAQITRHRLVSFSIKSQHYVEHDDFKHKLIENTNPKVKEIFDKLMFRINNDYKRMVHTYQVPIHVAREILPNACLTNIFMTANLREWRYIIKLRQTCNNTNEMKMFAERIRILFRDIMPEVFTVI